MIDRKAFQISGIIFLAMIAAALWRLSLQSGWYYMLVGPPSHRHAVSGLVLFAAPATLLMLMATLFLARLTEPKETLPAWRRWGGKWIVSWSVIMILIQAFVLARSLGLVALSNMGLARGVLVWMGIIFMIMGNAAPKAPSPPQRNSVELDSWQKIRLLRFAGKLLVGLGLAFVLGGVLLPLEYWRLIFGGLTLAAFSAGVWYQIKLRHEQRDKALRDAR